MLCFRIFRLTRSSAIYSPSSAAVAAASSSAITPPSPPLTLNGLWNNMWLIWTFPSIFPFLFHGIVDSSSANPWIPIPSRGGCRKIDISGGLNNLWVPFVHWLWLCESLNPELYCPFSDRLWKCLDIYGLQESLTYPWNDNSSDANPYPRSFQQTIPQVNAIPEGHKVSLHLQCGPLICGSASLCPTSTSAHLNVVPTVQPIPVVVDNDQDFGVNDVRNLSLVPVAAASSDLVCADEVTLQEIRQIGGSFPAKPFLETVWFHESWGGQGMLNIFLPIKESFFAHRNR